MCVPHQTIIGSIIYQKAFRIILIAPSQRRLLYVLHYDDDHGGLQGAIVSLERVMHFRLDDARLAVWNAKPTPVMSVMRNGSRHLLQAGRRHRQRQTALALSEIMTLLVYFHYGRCLRAQCRGCDTGDSVEAP
jgi:hypothetical protein